MVSVSIVVHKTPKSQLEKALECLLKSDVESIYIIENSPTPDFKPIVKLDQRIDYKHVKNNGYGAGHNIALKEAIKKDPNGFHLVMNADVWWKGDILSKLTAYMKKHEDVGIVMPKVFYPDEVLQYTCRMLPTPLDLIGKRFLPSFFMYKRKEKYLLMSHDHNKSLNCPYLLGSFLFFRNRALMDVGFFDERFFLYPEDIDLTRRIHREWKTMYWPEVSIIHEHQAASRKNLKMLKIHIINMIKYFNKWGWFLDKERKLYNKKLLKDISFLPKSERPEGRG